MITVSKEITIMRPRSNDWEAILEILKTANFHQIGGAEMSEFPLCDCFIAVDNLTPVGVAGYKMLDPTTAKTTLLTVHPDYRGRKIGIRLQQSRFAFLRDKGIKTIYTNCDDPAVIRWNERHFGFRKTGQLIPKVHEFGRKDKDHWVNLVADL